MQLKVRIIFRLVELNLLPEFIKLKLVRSIWSVGKDFKIGKNSFIFSNNVFIGHNVTIGDNVIIRANEVKIGNDTFIYKDTSITATVKVHIGDECVIAENVIVGGGQRNDSSFSMGKRVHVYPFCYLNTTRPLILEDGVGIGGGTYIFTHGSWQDAYEGFPFVYAPVTIKKNAWLPWRVFVMPGVTIGEEATIGSDALVTKDVPPRSFAAGVPARVIKRDHEYIKVMNTENKFLLLQEILSEFKKHIAWTLNINSFLEINSNNICLNFENGFKIIYTLEALSFDKKDVLILTELVQESEIHLHVFDLRNKRCKFPLNQIEQSLHSFITGYGIRLDIMRKYA